MSNLNMSFRFARHVYIYHALSDHVFPLRSSCLHTPISHLLSVPLFVISLIFPLILPFIEPFAPNAIFLLPETLKETKDLEVEE